MLQAFIGLTALKGGYGLVSDPTGATMNTPIEWLSNSPFANYFIPGLILLIVIGVFNILAAIITILRHIIHDWEDDESIAILRNCQEAMGPKGY